MKGLLAGLAMAVLLTSCGAGDGPEAPTRTAALGDLVSFGEIDIEVQNVDDRGESYAEAEEGDITNVDDAKGFVVVFEVSNRSSSEINFDAAGQMLFWDDGYVRGDQLVAEPLLGSSNDVPGTSGFSTHADVDSGETALVFVEFLSARSQHPRRVHVGDADGRFLLRVHL
jgi:hypothetical protein